MTATSGARPRRCVYAAGPAPCVSITCLPLTHFWQVKKSLKPKRAASARQAAAKPAAAAAAAATSPSQPPPAPAGNALEARAPQSPPRGRSETATAGPEEEAQARDQTHAQPEPTPGGAALDRQAALGQPGTRSSAAATAIAEPNEQQPNAASDTPVAAPAASGAGQADSETVAGAGGGEPSLLRQIAALQARLSETSGSEPGQLGELREQLQAEKAFRHELEMTVTSLTESKKHAEDELSQKLKKEERRSKALTKERDMLRRSTDSMGETEDRFRLKEDQVNSLMEEGERMSRQLGDKETQIRRMRAQLKELETTNQTLKDRLEATDSKLKSLNDAQSVLQAGDKEIKRELVDTSKENMHLTAQLEEQERTMKSLRSENAELVENLNQAREGLDEHRQSLARAAENAGAASVEAAEQAKTEMREKMSVEQRDFDERERALTLSLDELRVELERKTNELGRLEDRLRKDVQDAERRCAQFPTRFCPAHKSRAVAVHGKCAGRSRSTGCAGAKTPRLGAKILRGWSPRLLGRCSGRSSRSSVLSPSASLCGKVLLCQFSPGSSAPM